MKQKIGIVTDEASDLPEEIVNKYNIGIARFKVDLQNLINIPGNIYQKIREAEKIGIPNTIKTSQPSINEFLSVFKEKLKDFEEIICITMSSKVSGTYNSAIQAKKFLQKELQEKVHVFDSLNGSSGEGLVVLKSISLIKENLEIKKIIEKLKEGISSFKLLGVYEKPKWLESSGRVPRFIPALMKEAEKMSIKPIFGMKSGQLKVVGIKRNIKDLSSALFEEFEKATKKIKSPISVAITHADNIPQAERLKELINNLNNAKVLFTNLTCIPLGGHIGPGSLIISWKE